MTTRVKAFFVHLTRVRTPNHSDLRDRLLKLEKYDGPRRTFDAKGQAVSIVTPQPASTVRGSSRKVLSYEQWSETYDRDRRRA